MGRKAKPINSSSKALIEIHNLIRDKFGGEITAEEWKDADIPVYTIYKDRRCKNFYIGKTCVINVIAFHTKAQAKEFMRDDDNVDLLRKYYMI